MSTRRYQRRRFSPWHHNECSSNQVIDPNGFQDNEDFCAVCNGSGKFLCCERCPRSFHFTCLDPPLEVEPEGMWFCRKCQAQTNPPPKHPKGLFSQLLDQIDRRNPASYSLPLSIREYFDGVSTGKYGEYTDTGEVRRDGKNGYGTSPSLSPWMSGQCLFVVLLTVHLTVR